MTIPEILQTSSVIAIVGLSDNPDRSSYGVAGYLEQRGMTIIPVNPNLQEWHGIKCYPTVSSIPAEIQLDIVDIFRRPEYTPDVVRDALLRTKKPRCIWLQLGIENEEAKDIAEAAGVFFVEDRCTAIESRFANVVK